MTTGELARFDQVSEHLSTILETTINRYRTFDGKEPSLGEVKVALARLAVRRSVVQANVDKWCNDFTTAMRVLFNQRKQQ